MGDEQAAGPEVASSSGGRLLSRAATGSVRPVVLLDGHTVAVEEEEVGGAAVAEIEPRGDYVVRGPQAGTDTEGNIAAAAWRHDEHAAFAVAPCSSKRSA